MTLMRPLAFASALVMGFAATLAFADDMPAPGYQPDAASMEGGLWMVSDHAEKNLQTSPLLVKDVALNAYVRGVVCKLAADRCGSIRLYIMEVPHFNAYMMPNGAMVVWTGLLLRVQNEAQLAYILGHELTHYEHRHTLEAFHRAESTSTVMAFFGSL